ncbi:MAG: PAS domain S-box protein [candidate division Zixibacteria bacterium]|nr:PAS domain S-box protein [candidate division Zixibacteria bacterium]
MDNKFTILLVEDDSSHVELIRRSMAESDVAYTLEVSSNLTSAREKIDAGGIDLVLTDYKLPDGAGLELLPGIDEEVTLPIILMTSFGDERIAVEAIKNGAIDYVVKSGASFVAMPNVIKRARREWGHIVERKKAEKLLRKSEERVRTFIESAEDMVYFQALDGSLSMLNNANTKITGYSEQEFQDNPHLWRKIIQSDDVAVAEEFFRQYPKGTSFFDSEYRLTSKDGRVHWIQSHMVGVQDENGNYIGYNCIDRDITERKRSEEESEEINKCLLALGSDPIKNISILTKKCGEILNAKCALYYRLNRGMLCARGQWQTPKGYNPIDKPDGLICYDIIKQDFEGPIIVGDLQSTNYATTDPNVIALGLKTYIGLGVKLNDTYVGSLSVVFTDDFQPTASELSRMTIIAAAIAIEEKRRESLFKVQQSEERLELALESAGLGLWDHYFKTGTVYRSDYWSEMLGYSPQEIDSMVESWKELIHPDDLEYSNKVALDHEAGVISIYSVEHRMKTKSGEYKWILNWGKIVERDLDGNPIRATGTHLDITERKRAEEALKESEEKYRGIIDNISIGILLLDNNLIPVSVNSQMKSWFPGIEERKKPICDYVFTGLNVDKKCAYCPAEFTFKDGNVHESILKIQVKEEEKSFRIVTSPIRNQAGAISYVIELVEDITDKLRAEEDLAKADKLESIGVLAGGIAHDFNNILTAILGNISLARIELKEGSDVSDLLKEVELATVRAKDLTQQLLTFSKGGTPVKKAISIIEIIKDSANFALHGSNVKLDYNFPNDLFSVEVDEGQISQVISNLVINADQAMPEGGVITIECTNDSINEDSDIPIKPGDYVCIRIKDEGTGIPESHINKIFDPFFTTKQSGSGLGLATTYSIVRSHFGHIMVESEANVGTVFSLYLPATKLIVTKTDNDYSSIPMGFGSVLIVDDEDAVLRMARIVLKKLGYSPLTAHDGREAIDIYKKSIEYGEPVDIVIMDLTIPGGMGGKEAIIELKKIDPDVTAIVSSGYSNDPLMANYKSFGFVASVAKPYKAGDLGAVLQSILERKREKNN